MKSVPTPTIAACPEPYRQSFQVAFDYPVYFTSALLELDNPTLLEAVRRLEPRRRHRFIAIIDSGVLESNPDIGTELGSYVAHHSAWLELSHAPVIIDGGEHAKNSERIVEKLHGVMVGCHLDRQSPVLAIGGGAVLDVSGYAAATLHRGVRLIRVPTTVEAQCDSGVGVKNGINAFSMKNVIGTFNPPFAVINDASFLASLPDRERRSGSAEAVKVGLIRDARFFEWLVTEVEALAAFDDDASAAMIRRSAQLHLEHIATCGDPFEFGCAKPLDFGHWSAHKLETMSEYRLRHGEAVAIGIAIDARYSAQAGMISQHDCQRICRLLEGLGFSLWDNCLETVGDDGRLQVLEGLREFREHLGGELSLTMLASIGRGVDVTAIDEDLMQQAIAWLGERNRRNETSG